MDPLQGIERRSGPPPDVPSVGEVTARIKECVEGRFADVWVAGEVTNVVRAASGHVYLAIKDAAAILRFRTVINTYITGYCIACFVRNTIYCLPTCKV